MFMPNPGPREGVRDSLGGERWTFSAREWKLASQQPFSRPGYAKGLVLERHR